MGQLESHSTELEDKSIRNEVKRGMGSFLKGDEQKIQIELFNKVAEREDSCTK